jgi:hypothetical protein
MLPCSSSSFWNIKNRLSPLRRRATVLYKAGYIDHVWSFALGVGFVLDFLFGITVMISGRREFDTCVCKGAVVDRSKSHNGTSVTGRTAVVDGLAHIVALILSLSFGGLT